MQIDALVFVVVFHSATGIMLNTLYLFFAISIYKILPDNSTKKKKTREKKVEVFNTGCTPQGRA